MIYLQQTVVVDVPVTREDAIPFSGSSSYYAAVAAMVVSAVETMDVEATMIVFGSSCFSSAVADAAETMDVVSASQIICSEMAVGYSGRPIRFIKKNVSACYGRDVFVCQPNLRTLCVLIPCSILTVFFPILLLHHLLVDSTFLWHFLFSDTFLIYLINTVIFHH